MDWLLDLGWLGPAVIAAAWLGLLSLGVWVLSAIFPSAPRRDRPAPPPPDTLGQIGAGRHEE